MKGFARVVAVTALTITGVAGLVLPPALAQQPPQPGTNGTPPAGGAVAANPADLAAALAKMPPALKAAVLSSNTDAIKLAIATLAGDNATKAGALADQVVHAAEQIFANDPKSGIQVAQGAVYTIQANTVQEAAPQQTQEVITVAARLFINPAAQAAAPDATAQLAMSSVTAASTTNNASLITTTAGQAVSVAEKMLSSNASVAVQIVGVATQAIKQDNVVASNAAKAMDVAVAAARVVVRPEVQALSDSSAANAVKTALFSMVSTQQTADTKTASQTSDQTQTTKDLLAGKEAPVEVKTVEKTTTTQTTTTNTATTTKDTTTTNDNQRTELVVPTEQNRRNNASGS